MGAFALEQIATPKGHGNTAAEQMLLAELVGLRTILLNPVLQDRQRRAPCPV